jgi:hypothetical protein
MREHPAPRTSALARGVLALVRLYQGLTAHRPSPCRYIPTCSEYAREAVEVHGAVRGGVYALRRLGRCHPLGGFGFDPVPDPRATTAHRLRRADDTGAAS